MLYVKSAKAALLSLAWLVSQLLSVTIGAAQAPTWPVLGFHAVHPTMGVVDVTLGRVPDGYKVYNVHPDHGLGEKPLLLRIEPVVTGDDLVDAQQAFDSRTNEAVINFRFNQKGARVFGRFTQENIGRPFAIVLDEKVLSAPVIRSEILGGSGQISGTFTLERAQELAARLRVAAERAKAAPHNGSR